MKERLDQALVSRGLVSSRSRAADAIARGEVLLNGHVAQKAGQKVDATSQLSVDAATGRYVSRAALKLLAALDHFGFEPEGRIALDLGASTGGFTQVMLERGAAHVFAVDVGHDQLHKTLQSDQRITNLEGFNARDMTPAHFDKPVTALVSDVSFISLRLALPPAFAVLEPGAFFVALVKPQFEVGRKAIGKGGIVRDAQEAERAANDIRKFVDEQPGFRVLDLIRSPITGRTGNVEYLLGGWFDGAA